MHRQLLPLVAAVCFVSNLLLSTKGWNLPLLDVHAFRQTQTALTAYWFVQEGLAIDYATPVLGPPWAVPLEFPLYQWLVAALHSLSGYGLDQCGRLVSLLFFYATLVPAFALAKFVWRDSRAGWILVCMMLVNPIHIYWGRACLIETTVLFLSTAYLWFFCQALYHGRIHSFVLAICLGCLAGLVKPTTYATFLVASSLVAIHFAYGRWRAWGLRDWAVFAARCSALTLISIVAVYLWTRHCDSIKLAHPYQPLVSTSAEMSEWNYGSLAQRLDWRLWKSWILGYSGWVMGTMPLAGWLGAIALAALVLASIATAGSRAALGLALLATWLSGPLVFFNLFVHDYYQMAITIWTCALVTFALMEFVRRYPPMQYSVPMLAAVMLAGYAQTRYMMYQERPRSHYSEIEGAARYIRDNTDQDRDVVFVFSKTWSSELAYYSQRKTRMHLELTEDSVSDERFAAFRKAVEDAGMRVGAVVVATPVPEAVLARALSAFTPPGLPPPTPAQLPLSRERFSGWPVEPGNPAWQSGLVYVIPAPQSAAPAPAAN